MTPVWSHFNWIFTSVELVKHTFTALDLVETFISNTLEYMKKIAGYFS